MNLTEDVQAAYKAKELVESPIFKDAIENIRQGIVAKWRSAPVRDLEGQHELKLMDKVLSEIEGYFKQVIETGKMAEIQLENEKRMQLVKKSGIR